MSEIEKLSPPFPTPITAAQKVDISKRLAHSLIQQIEATEHASSTPLKDETISRCEARIAAINTGPIGIKRGAYWAKRLAGAWPTLSPHDPEMYAVAISHALGEMAEHEAATVVDMAIRTLKFPPSVAELGGVRDQYIGAAECGNLSRLIGLLKQKRQKQIKRIDMDNQIAAARAKRAAK